MFIDEDRQAEDAVRSGEHKGLRLAFDATRKADIVSAKKEDDVG